MGGRWWRAPLWVVAGLLLFVLFTIVFTPARALQGVVERGAENAGYSFAASSFSKAFPFGIKLRNMELGDERGLLFRVDEARVRLRFLPLLLGRVSFDYDLQIGKGSMSGGFSPLGGGRFDCAMEGVSLEDIPFFATATGSRVKGLLQGEGSFSGSGAKARGSGRVEISRMDLSGVRIGGMPLPDASFDTARGALKVEWGKALLESATLEGPGIYVRLKGDLPVTAPLGRAPLNITLEILPKADFLERQKAVFLLLARYMVSPGNYRIPIRGTLSNPSIQ